MAFSGTLPPPLLSTWFMDAALHIIRIRIFQDLDKFLLSEIYSKLLLYSDATTRNVDIAKNFYGFDRTLQVSHKEFR